AAKLDWPAFEREPQRSHLDRFHALMALRRDVVWPLVASACESAQACHAGGALAVTWRFAAGTLTLATTLADHPGTIAGPAEAPGATLGWVSHDGTVRLLGPWAAALWSSAGSGATP